MEVSMSTVELLGQIVPTGTWNADQKHSQVGFSVRHMKISTLRGVFPEVTATLTGGSTPTLEGSLEIASVTTRVEDLDGHLLSPDFFDAERYPKASFRATLVEPSRVVGEFTLKGVTKEIDLAATFTGPDTDPWGNTRIGLELEGEINRHDYGVSWNTALPGGGFLLEDEVKLFASFSFVKAA
jgi:polyisoprenoid-binding protein YceI